jgi:energy-coupling factor transporter transmembrane protein EcfT
MNKNYPLFKPLIICLIIGLLSLSKYGISYIGGRLNNPWVLFGIIVVFFLILVFLIALIVTLIVVLVSAKRKKAKLSYLFLILFLGIILSSFIFILNTDSVFQSGLRHRILNSVSADDLRLIAQTAKEIIPVNEQIPGPEKKSLWIEEEHRAKWEYLTEKTSINKLDPWFVVYVYENSVDIIWGGALMKHWGIVIYDNLDQRDIENTDIAEDIGTFIAEY